jgi:hypothetical protein
LEKVCTGEVLDISIGGAQLRLATSTTLRETQRFVGIIDLPTEKLGFTPNDPLLVLLIQFLSQDKHETLDGKPENTQNIIRVRFLGRYLKDQILGTWDYRGVTQTSMEDLAHWLQAYQRYNIMKRKHLLPPDATTHRPPNMFPSHPPKRPPLKDA